MKLKRYFIVTLGTIVLSLGLYFFLIPSKLATGGLTGLSIVLNEWIPSLSIGSIMLAGNIILFIVAFILIGKEFGALTIYSALMTSFLVGLLERFLPLQTPPVDDVLLNLIFGTVIPATGMAIIFYQNASTGGTDILAKILNKFFHIPIGRALMFVDFVVVLLAAKSFGLRLGLYALLGVFLNGYVIDTIITGFHSRLHVKILSSEYEKISEFIIKTIDRSTTLYPVKGGYSKSDKIMLETILSKRQYIVLKQFVSETDPRALMSVGFVHEVIGEGFHTFK
ncbi:YitT family protein [Guggenheimella bovis]